MQKMCVLHKIGWALVLVGALNWGLVGLFSFNLVHAIFGSWMTVERVVYVVVGLAAVFSLFTGSCGKCKECMMGDKKM